MRNAQQPTSGIGESPGGKRDSEPTQSAPGAAPPASDHPRQLPCRAALLLHELPDGTSHFDLLLQPTHDPDSPLIAFRLWSRPDDRRVVKFPAQRQPDHRPLYLDYEGEISEGRGRVTRLARGSCDVRSERDGAIDFVVQFGENERHIRGRVAGGSLWWFNAEP